MAQPEHTSELALLEEALSVLFCLIDDTYARLNPHGGRCYASLKRLSDSEVLALALFEQLREGWSPAAPSCARPPASSRTCSPGGRRPSSLLVSPSYPQTQALPGVLAARYLARACGRPRDPDRRLEPAFGPASAPGFSVGAF
jgi:hypothetical protein